MKRVAGAGPQEPRRSRCEIEAIRVERRDGLVTITLDRPEKKNAIDAQMWVGLD
jgi:1,4-dihydroxy-2-naphthoyl-CoA synthase